MQQHINKYLTDIIMSEEYGHKEDILQRIQIKYFDGTDARRQPNSKFTGKTNLEMLKRETKITMIIRNFKVTEVTN